MPQLAIYIDDKTQKKIDQAAKREGKSRSLWVKEAIVQKIEGGIPESWFNLWGSWEDTRSTDEIIQDIKRGYQESERALLK